MFINTIIVFHFTVTSFAQLRIGLPNGVVASDFPLKFCVFLLSYVLHTTYSIEFHLRLFDFTNSIKLKGPVYEVLHYVFFWHSVASSDVQISSAPRPQMLYVHPLERDTEFHTRAKQRTNCSSLYFNICYY
jgi:hypothetical protein